MICSWSHRRRPDSRVPRLFTTYPEAISTRLFRNRHRAKWFAEFSNPRRSDQTRSGTEFLIQRKGVLSRPASTPRQDGCVAPKPGSHCSDGQLFRSAEAGPGPVNAMSRTGLAQDLRLSADEPPRLLLDEFPGCRGLSWLCARPGIVLLLRQGEGAIPYSGKHNSIGSS